MSRVSSCHHRLPPPTGWFVQVALRSDPGFADAWSNMGNCLKDLGRFEDAIRAYQQAITLRPGFADAYGNLASVYKDTGLLDRAIEYYRKSLALKVGGEGGGISRCVHSRTQTSRPISCSPPRWIQSATATWCTACRRCATGLTATLCLRAPQR